MSTTFNGTLTLTIADAKDLVSKDYGRQDPYCKIIIGSRGYKKFMEGDSWGDEILTTKTHEMGGTNPVWNETHTINITNMQLDTRLSIALYDRDRFKDDYIGITRITLGELLENQNQKYYYDLAEKPYKPRIAGRVGLVAKFNCTEIPRITGTLTDYIKDMQRRKTEKKATQGPIMKSRQRESAQQALSQGQTGYQTTVPSQTALQGQTGRGIQTGTGLESGVQQAGIQSGTALSSGHVGTGQQSSLHQGVQSNPQSGQAGTGQSGIQSGTQYGQYGQSGQSGLQSGTQYGQSGLQSSGIQSGPQSGTQYGHSGMQSSGIQSGSQSGTQYGQSGLQSGPVATVPSGTQYGSSGTQHDQSGQVGTSQIGGHSGVHSGVQPSSFVPSNQTGQSGGIYKQSDLDQIGTGLQKSGLDYTGNQGMYQGQTGNLSKSGAGVTSGQPSQGYPSNIVGQKPSH